MSVIEAINTEEDSVPEETVLGSVCEGEVSGNEVSADPDELPGEDVTFTVGEVLGNSWVENVDPEDPE